MIHYILFRTQAHATEDVSRVEEALEHVLPLGTPIEREETKGYFDNPITILRAGLEKKAAEDFMEFLRTSLPESDYEELIKELPQRVSEDTNFYLRLSKQDAYLGDVRITYAEDAISIRAKIATYPAKYELALKQVREYFHAEE